MSQIEEEEGLKKKRKAKRRRVFRARKNIETDSRIILFLAAEPPSKPPAKIFAQHRMFPSFFRWFFERDAWYFNFFLQLKWKKNQ